MHSVHQIQYFLNTWHVGGKEIIHWRISSYCVFAQSLSDQISFSINALILSWCTPRCYVYNVVVLCPWVVVFVFVHLSVEYNKFSQFMYNVWHIYGRCLAKMWTLLTEQQAENIEPDDDDEGQDDVVVEGNIERLTSVEESLSAEDTKAAEDSGKAETEDDVVEKEVSLRNCVLPWRICYSVRGWEQLYCIWASFGLIKNLEGVRKVTNHGNVPAAVSGSATGECGLLPQHFHHRINVAVVTLLTLQYLLPTGFVLVG